MIKTYTLLVQHQSAHILMEILNEMQYPCVAVRLQKGFRISVALSEREFDQICSIVSPVQIN